MQEVALFLVQIIFWDDELHKIPYILLFNDQLLILSFGSAVLLELLLESLSVSAEAALFFFVPSTNFEFIGLHGEWL